MPYMDPMGQDPPVFQLYFVVGTDLQLICSAIDVVMKALQNDATSGKPCKTKQLIRPCGGFFEAPYISVLGKKSEGLFFLTWAAPEFSRVFKPGSQWYEHQWLEALGSSLKSSGECILGALGGQVPCKDKKKSNILSMVQKAGKLTSWAWFIPLFTRFLTSQVVMRMSEPSTVCP